MAAVRRGHFLKLLFSEVNYSYSKIERRNPCLTLILGFLKEDVKVTNVCFE